MVCPREDVPVDQAALQHALHLCEEALEVSSRDGKLHARRAKLLRQLGREHDAQESAEAAERLRPSSERRLVPSATVVRFEEALTRMRNGDAEGAERLLEAVVRDAPAWPEGWVALRSARWAQGRRFAAANTLEEWQRASPADAVKATVVAARPLSRRGWLFDPRDPLPLVRKEESLKKVSRGDELLLTESDAYVVVHPGGEPVHHSPIVSVSDDGSDWFEIKTQTSESFVAAFSSALVVGRGLVITRGNTVVRDTLTAANNFRKYRHARIRDGVVRFQPNGFAHGGLPLRIVEDAALLMAGPTDKSFGDWIWRFPPRLTLARELGIDVPLVVSTHLPARYLEMLELLGYERSRFVYHDPNSLSVFRKLIVTSWPTDDRLRPMKGWTSVYAPLAELGTEPQATPPGAFAPPPKRRLYLARTNVHDRRLINEADVLKVFEQRGFEIVHPQNLSLRELFSTFATAAVVAGPFGSAFRNLAFCRNRPIAFVLMPPHDREFLVGCVLWLAELDARVAYVSGQEEAIRESTNPRLAPWSLDLLLVERALDRVVAASG